MCHMRGFWNRDVLFGLIWKQKKLPFVFLLTICKANGINKVDLLRWWSARSRLLLQSKASKIYMLKYPSAGGRARELLSLDERGGVL